VRLGRYDGPDARLTGVEWRVRSSMPMFERMDAAWLPRNRWMRRSLIGAIVLYGWTIFGILSSAHFFLGEEGSAGVSLEDLASHILLFYWAWAAVTPLVLLALRRAVDARASRRVRWEIIVAATPVVMLAHGLVYLAAVRVFGVEPMSPIGASELRDYALRHGGGDLATMAVLVGVYLLLNARQRAHAREVAATALESRLAVADLEVLRSQLQPHFLFNALNTVSTLVLKGDTTGADDAIGRISRYLRSALEQRADATVTLGDEILDVQQYFAIERLRFGDALCLDVEVPDSVRGAHMPALILQPLVENAIRHGMSPGSAGMRIGVTAAIGDGRLRLRVTNPATANAASANGAGRTNGFGLRYVRERLHLYYGDDATLALSTAAMGTVATIDLPLTRRLPAAST
jgi:two-component system LytT family sensor kinase